MKLKATRGGIQKRPGRSWALDKAQHKKEIEAETKIAGPAIDDSDAAAGLMLLCSELSTDEKLVQELSMEAQKLCNADEDKVGGEDTVVETKCPNCNATLGTQKSGPKDAESPASVIGAFQWGEVAVCSCMLGAKPQDAPKRAAVWNAGVVRELMQAPPPKGVPAVMTTQFPGRPPVYPQRSSARRKEKNEAVAARELVEMREEIMTDQRLIAELAQAALLPILGEEIAT